MLGAERRAAYGHEKDRGVSGGAAEGPGHDPAGGGGPAGGLQQDRQQMGKRPFLYLKT